MEGAEIRPKNIARQNLSDAEKIATSKDSLLLASKPLAKLAPPPNLKNLKKTQPQETLLEIPLKAFEEQSKTAKNSINSKKPLRSHLLLA